MGFNFSFFGENEHRVFNYKPRYYDPEKEERRRMFGKVDGSLDKCQDDSQDAPGAYTPGKYISGSFRDGNYQRTHRDSNKAQKIIGIIGLILVFIVFWYFAQFYSLILG